MEPTILIKIESPDQDCQKCFYYQSDSDGGNECCCRPSKQMRHSDDSQDDQCFDEQPGGKYYIFVETKQTK